MLGKMIMDFLRWLQERHREQGALVEGQPSDEIPTAEDKQVENGGAASDGVSPAPAILEHRFAVVPFHPTPNTGGPLTGGLPRYIIIHYTGNGSLTQTVKHFQKERSAVSAHLIIGRDGQVAQMVNFDQVAWHAGKSQWGDIKNLNSCSIGIEIVNWGKLEEDADGNVYTWASQPIPVEESKAVYDETADRSFVWHKYTEEQMEVVYNVCIELFLNYPTIEDVLGHFEISPGRKLDPGPLFDMEALRQACYAARMYSRIPKNKDGK